ncbi:conserved hypothetical protein [Vibrio chagasii]|nr:hypothetical protein [Vibrio chagasii]CAH6875232.1 conserved hypothetical protein [Vibrio chagasii]CAH6887955.1 conserved hypothetical protein [Vibrio chagasii]CAH6909216.1 conserved hypothetical protein [Vibrio chagasii]CAH7135079.1 conserved hypothetical protein [Vibrio chagasii]CAH7236263.1 conserved hypothetical protein [Vibrio chagasii]
MTTPKEKAKSSRVKKAGKSTENQVPKTRQRIEELLEERELAKLLEL